MLIGRHDHPVACTRVDIDMRIDAALTDEPQGVEALEQRLADLRTLTNQHEHLRACEARRERLDVLGVIVPDRYFMAVQFVKAGETTKRVEIIIENCNLHGTFLSLRLWR